MDIHGLRTMNLVGTIIFGIFGVLMPLFIALFFGFMLWIFPSGALSAVFFTICLAWIIVVVFLTYQLYENTVIGLDRGNFAQVKRWTLIGMICGFIFAGGILTFILFLISYISIDDAIWPKFYGPPPFGYYPPPYQYAPPYPPQQSRQPYPPNLSHKNHHYDPRRRPTKRDNENK